MRKLIKWTVFLLLVSFVYNGLSLSRDRQSLRDGLIRLHVVAASDTQEDQNVKLKVRDAVISYVDQAMQHVMTVEEAKAWLQENLPGIRDAANDVLQKLGLEDRAEVTLESEAFPVRHYDTFSLPSGVYDALRVTIGEGEGRNWWCVVFPSLCLNAAGVEDVAAGAGFSQDLGNTITGQQGYQLRFYFLDVLGKIENFFFGT